MRMRCQKRHCVCVFPVEPQSPDGKNINLHKKWGSRRSQKECQKVQKKCGKPHFLRKKCGSWHFLALFLESAGTPLSAQINVFAVWALRLDRKYTNTGRVSSHSSHRRGKHLQLYPIESQGTLLGSLVLRTYRSATE